MRRRWGELYRTVERLSGAPADEVRAFFATGMLLNVAAAIDLPEIAGPKGAPGPAARSTGSSDVYHAIVARRLREAYRRVGAGTTTP